MDTTDRKEREVKTIRRGFGPGLGNRSVHAMGFAVLLVGGCLGVASCAAEEEGSQAQLDIRTISCPDIASSLSGGTPNNPQAQARLGLLDQQVSNAYDTLSDSAGGTPRGEAEILAEVAELRRRTITELADETGAAPQQKAEMMAMADCTVTHEPAGEEIGVLKGKGGNERRGSGLTRRDYVDITQVTPNTGQQQPNTRQASTGTFTSKCGNNGNDPHINPDNVVISPGERAAAHHQHDYVGNRTTDFRSTVESLRKASTTCSNGDLSTYYAPVVRLLDGRQEDDAKDRGGGLDRNQGTILTPEEFGITFKGNPFGKVNPLPDGMVAVVGDAKAFTNGLKNARASWSCTGFEAVQLRDKYPLCPSGSNVIRTFSFPNCSNGQANSANHRTHTAFSGSNGQCPKGFEPIPQLVMAVSYRIPQGAFYAVDSFPEQLHKPVTDHADFINVMPKSLMQRAVTCINSGTNC
ncbi:DUF1996 domain-containing protein [Kitasatospora sp. NPDC058170]|uniref:DUF1996 domain-containing protein n=1 Tax=Kitasatospora sp. NPDC058170 TaxID=3346364 RepID=UPI0036D81E50